MLSLTPDGQNYQDDNGRIYERITHVLKSEGLAPDLSPFVDPAYAVRGKHLHHMTELVDDGTLDEEALFPPYKPYLEAYKRFRNDVPFGVVSKEQTVCSPRFGVAGTLDRRVVMGGQYWILDYKFYGSSADVFWHHYQTAMYAVCLNTEKDMRASVIINPNFHFGYKMHVHSDFSEIEIAKNILAVRAFRRAHRIIAPKWGEFNDPEVY